MSPLEKSPDAPADAWRTALLASLASMPFTAALYWQSMNTHAFTPVFVAGVLVGCLYSRRTTESTLVGARTGLVGALPAVVLVFEMFTFVAQLASPASFRAIQVATVLFLFVGIVALSALVGMVGAMVGDWLVATTDRSRSFVTGNWDALRTR